MTDRRIAAGLFLVTFVAYAWFFGGGGWNQNANFDLTRAIVERGTFRIDAYRSNTYDISFNAGHVYANKAPGLSMLACIPYAFVYAVERAAGVDVSSFAATTFNQYLCTVATCATSGALLIAIFFLYARRKGARAIDSLIVSLAVAFGTYVFAYATVFFAHVPTALLLFWCFARLADAPDDRPWIAGALGGAAVLCNYPVLLPLVFIAIGAIAMPGARVRRAAQIAAGGVLFAVVLLVYQTVCFGSPFRTAVEATSGVFQTRGAFLGVFVAPRIPILYAITLSRYRGLFLLCPVLVFSFAGCVVLVRRREMLRELAIIAAVFVSLLLINASFNGWHGGSAIGPRYMLPVVPFLAVPMLFATSIFRFLFGGLMAISFVFNFTVAAVNPMPSRLIADPLFRYTFPLFLTGHLPADTPPFPPVAWKQMLGHVSVNRLSADEMVAFMKHPPGSFESEWASFNLGELVAPGSVLSVVPIVIWIVGGAMVLGRSARRQSESTGSIEN